MNSLQILQIIALAGCIGLGATAIRTLLSKAVRKASGNTGSVQARAWSNITAGVAGVAIILPQVFNWGERLTAIFIWTGVALIIIYIFLVNKMRRSKSPN